MKLANKVALITGAGKGIGRGIAVEFAKEGADVIVNYHASVAGSEEVAEEVRGLGRRCMTIQVDVGNWKQAQEMVDRAWNEFGHIDILVNNAGITLFSDFFEITEQDWDRVLDTNLKGAFACSQAVATYLKNANLPGRIIHIGSIHSLVTVPYCHAVYRF